MEILAFSDIHSETNLVNKLSKQIKDRNIEAILFAGDFGSLKDAKEIIFYFADLRIPFLYVLGNHDPFDYSEILSEFSVHIHLNPVEINGYFFLGYSGCATNDYERNPSVSSLYNELKKKFTERQWLNSSQKIQKYKTSFYKKVRKIRDKEILDLIKEKNIPPERIILVSHERITSLKFKPFLHIFGHRHESTFSKYRNINFLNVSSLSFPGHPLFTPKISWPWRGKSLKNGVDYINVSTLDKEKVQYYVGEWGDIPPPGYAPSMLIGKDQLFCKDGDPFGKFHFLNISDDSLKVENVYL